MKIATFLGTRPELIRLSAIIELLDRYVDHILIDTGQNYDHNLSGRFYDELPVRHPDEQFNVQASGFGEQIGHILARGEAALLKHRPDRVLILGDTNSGLIAIVAKRMGIPVYHMEAGNRCFDDRVPEEVNRRVIDHSSTVLMPYTHRSKENLIREGFAGERIYVTGNPINEVIQRSAEQIRASTAVRDAGVEENGYFFVTAHRSENVDHRERLSQIMLSLEQLHREYRRPILYSVHPRAQAKLEKYGLGTPPEGVRFLPPLGLFDFVKLEQNAFCILSDSGTVQEEACLFGVPNVTLRDVTERPETVECGSNVLSGCHPDEVKRAVRIATESRGQWTPPQEYTVDNVANTVCRIVTGFRSPDAAELDWRCGNRF